MRIAGKVALVTGGARGLGKAFSGAVLDKGGKVCILDANAAEGTQTLCEFKQKFGDDSVLFIKCDVTDDVEFQGAFQAAKARFGQIHIMVNNAGILNEVTWEKMLNINLIALVRGTNLALDHMRKDKGGEGGLILNMGSIAGLVSPSYQIPAYAASKYGVVGFTRSWANNPFCGEYGVSFACLCPSFCETRIFEDTVVGANPPIVHPDTQATFRKQTMDIYGVNSVANVVSAFLELVEKDDNNGAVVEVTKHRGIKYTQ